MLYIYELRHKHMFGKLLTKYYYSLLSIPYLAKKQKMVNCTRGN